MNVNEPIPDGIATPNGIQELQMRPHGHRCTAHPGSSRALVEA
jgi:hypothetical protein